MRARGTLWVLFLALLAPLVLVAIPALAAQCPLPKPPGCRGTGCSVGFTECPDPSEPDPGGSGSGGTQPIDQHPARYSYLPTCTSNVLGAGDALCPGATTTCPVAGDVRYHVYVSTWDVGRGAYGPQVLRTNPPYVCLGPDQAAVLDPRLAVIAQVRADWRSFPLPGAQVRTEPNGETLANAVTRLAGTTPGTATLAPRPVLGLDVTLTITAVRYLWSFGDGTTQVAAAASGSLPRTEHKYDVAGPAQVSLRTYYTATFTIADDPQVYPLPGEADVPGAPSVLVVREARTQLVDG